MSHDDSHTCACGGNCGCQDNQQSQTLYLTREEYIARLNQYLADLKAEVSAVEKELMELQAPVVMTQP